MRRPSVEEFDKLTSAPPADELDRRQEELLQQIEFEVEMRGRGMAYRRRDRGTPEHLPLVAAVRCIDAALDISLLQLRSAAGIAYLRAKRRVAS